MVPGQGVSHWSVESALSTSPLSVSSNMDLANCSGCHCDDEKS